MEGAAASAEIIRAAIYNTVWWDGFGAGFLVSVMMIGIGWMTWATVLWHIRRLRSLGVDLNRMFASRED